MKILARFILETDDPSGRTWQRKNSSNSSDNSSGYKHGQADGSSVKANYLRRTVLTDDPSVCPRLYTDEFRRTFVLRSSSAFIQCLY